MKRVLLLIPSYSIGGITLSLYALLSKIDPQVIQVDVLAKPVGYYKGKLPNCNELKENFWLSYPLVNGNIMKKSLQWMIYGIRYVFSKIHVNLFPLIYWFGGKSLNSTKYDAVINYCEGTAYLNSFLPAKKKITWIHCDYRRHLQYNIFEKQEYAYSKYDRIVTVSQFAKSTFISVFPHFSEKANVIYNSIDEAGIQEKAKITASLDARFKYDCFTMVSIGRLDPVKQFNLIPEIACEIKQRTDKPFRWYIIGGGTDSWIDNIEKEIVNKNVKDTVIMLGEQPNVYPYISKSDLLVHTSKSESFSLVVKEAKCLNVPSMINDYECAREFVDDGINGFIVPVERMGKQIADIIETPTLLEPVISNLRIEQSYTDSIQDDFLRLL